MFLPREKYEQIQADLLAPFVDANIDELLINRFDWLWIVSRGHAQRWKSPFGSDAEYENWILEFALQQQVRLDARHRSSGGWLINNRMRWHALVPPLCPDGPLFSLRRHRFETLDVSAFAISAQDIQLIKSALQQIGVVVIAGMTGSGKSSLLACLMDLFCGDERVLIMEAIGELPVHNDRWVRLVQGGDDGFERLLAEALRMRPDRMVIGEVRSTEVRCLVQAASSGHGAVLTTLHAGDTKTALERLRSLGGKEDSCFDLLPITVVMMKTQGQPGVSRVETVTPTSCRKVT